MGYPPESHAASASRFASYCTQNTRNAAGQWGETPTLQSGSARARRHELVALNFCRDAHLAILRGLHANNSPVATDVHVACGNHLLRQRQNERSEEHTSELQ